jgi:Cu-Zn family superoxide dismutase
MTHLLLAGALGVSLLTACTTTAADAPEKKAEGAAAADKAHDDKAAAAKTATANVMGAGDMKDKIKGTLTFAEHGDGVKVTGEITGLTPGPHGFHVHEKGDLSDPKLVSAGPHFNPDKGKHGGPDSHDRPRRDLGNITADDKGVAKVDMTIKGISVAGEKNGIVGRAIIVHAKADDLKTDPSGNSGDRIAGGVIEKQAAADKSSDKRMPKDSR